MDPPQRTKQSWWRKRHVVLGLSIVTGLILVVFVQLLYPAGKALPLARIGESSVGSQTFQQVTETVRYDYNDIKFTIAVPGKKPYETTTSQAGIVPGYRHAAEAVTDYSLEARLVPFSFVYKLLKNQPVGYEIDQANFDAFYEVFAQYCRSDAKDATLVFAGGDVKIDSAKDGQVCEKPALLGAVKSLTLQKERLAMTAPVKVIEPRQNDADLQGQLASAKRTIESGVTVKTTKDSWPVPKETIASWMTTVDANRYVALDVKMDAVKAYLETLRGKLYVEPGVTKVVYHDGVVTKRVAGVRGQGIDVDVTAERVKAVLLGAPADERVAWVQLTIIEPRVATEWTYSASEKGLQALLEQWQRSHSARYGLMVRDLSGKGMNGEFNGDRDFVTASTFKLFLAYAVLHKIEAGELSMDSRTDVGLSTRACMDEMIVLSTNACALSLFNLAGWDYVHNFIRGQFPSTSLKNSVNADNEKHTTVRDVTTFLVKLNAGQLMDSGNTEYLLSLMRRQVYRNGIPRGVPGVTVADKVGFYNGWKHDAGIVYANRGTYILGFLSHGGSDPQIADLTRQVHELLSR